MFGVYLSLQYSNFIIDTTYWVVIVSVCTRNPQLYVCLVIQLHLNQYAAHDIVQTNMNNLNLRKGYKYKFNDWRAL